MARKQSQDRRAVWITTAPKHAHRFGGRRRGDCFVATVLGLRSLLHFFHRLLPTAGSGDERGQRRGLEQKPDRDAHAQAPPD
jgi:hypothetical protein